MLRFVKRDRFVPLLFSAVLIFFARGAVADEAASVSKSTDSGTASAASRVGAPGSERESPRFSGIGVKLDDKDDGTIAVAGFYGDSPAKKAGLRIGDVILAVDGRQTKGLSLMGAVQWIRGPSGTLVVLTVRESDGNTRKVSLIRTDVSASLPPLDRSVRIVGILLQDLNQKECPAMYKDCPFTMEKRGRCFFSCKVGK